MPNKEFLEKYPLYKKLKLNNFECRISELAKPKIKMSCHICDSEQTFIMQNQYWELANNQLSAVTNQIFRAKYRCAHCDKSVKTFFIKFNVKQNDSWLMKVGQFPMWEISTDKNLVKLLGKHSPLYKKGLICESQSYGIGAFGYYRRIVEVTIDELLNEISFLLVGDELSVYENALEKVKQTRVTAEKIALVKDLLPAILRPNDLNPLSVLHSTLSEGLHAQDDETCLNLAEECREIIVYLVSNIEHHKNTANAFTQNMQSLLEKKKGLKNV